MSKKTNKNNEEWNNNDLCPCGSGKKYKDCCKRKSIKYYKKNENEYIKSIPIEKPVKEIFIKLEKRFKDVFGRKPSKDNYVILEILENDMRKLTRELKYSDEIPNDYVYAYDRTGLMVSPFNMDKLPDVEIEQFKKVMQEYNDLMNQDLKGDKANILQAAEATNIFIKNIWEENVNDMIYVLNRYIKENSEKTGLKSGFTINNRKDFLVYCSYKIVQNLRTLIELINQGYTENALAVVRFIYEILLNVKVYIKDIELFKDKILPLAGLDNGTFKKKENNSNILIEKNTGKEYYCSIKVSKLANLAGQEYEELYNTLYYDLSGFIHVDTLAAKKIFADIDNFLDIDECYLAGILALIFTLEIIGELANFNETEEQLSKDFLYFINSRLDIFLEVLDMIKNIDDKKVYSIVKKTLLFIRKIKNKH